MEYDRHWTKEWPNKAGFYWAYGYFWGDSEKEINLVRSMEIANGFIYACRGTSISETSKDHKLMFAKCFLPTPPINFDKEFGE